MSEPIARRRQTPQEHLDGQYKAQRVAIREAERLAKDKQLNPERYPNE